MARQLLGDLELAAVLKVGGDPGGAEAVGADLGAQSCSSCPPQDHHANDDPGRYAGLVAGVEESFDTVEILFSVDADGVVLRGGDVEVEAVFEEAELLEALGALERARWKLGEAVEGFAAVGIEADVLPVVGIDLVTVVGDRGTGEVEGATVGGGDDLDGVGIGDILCVADDLEGGDVYRKTGVGPGERG